MEIHIYGNECTQKESQGIPKGPQATQGSPKAIPVFPRYGRSVWNDATLRPRYAADGRRVGAVAPQKCKNAPKWTQNEIYGELLFRKNVEMKKCVWTAPARTDCI